MLSSTYLFVFGGRFEVNPGSSADTPILLLDLNNRLLIQTRPVLDRFHDSSKINAFIFFMYLRFNVFEVLQNVPKCEEVLQSALKCAKVSV